MQLCLNTSCFSHPVSDGRPDLHAKIRIAADAGYALLELWTAELEAYVEQGGALDELRSRIEDAGLGVGSIVTLRGWMESTGADHAAALDDCRRRLELAAAVGAPRIVATPPVGRQDSFYPLDMDRAATCYRELLELGEQFGVYPMMEFLGFTNAVYQLEIAEAIVEMADHPQATLVLDPFHLWRGGSSFARIASVPVERIGICHFNDAPADNPPRFEQTDADRVYPGDGCLPLEALLRTLNEKGYDRALSLELFNPSQWAMDPETNIRRGMEKTRAVLEAAGL